VIEKKDTARGKPQGNKEIINDVGSLVLTSDRQLSLAQLEMEPAGVRGTDPLLLDPNPHPPDLPHLPLVGLEAETGLGGDRRGEAFAAWRRFVEALAERGPLVLVGRFLGVVAFVAVQGAIFFAGTWLALGRRSGSSAAP
jgi:hypothetical protein